ncbi:hypothetical protein G3I40_07390 [Streptomyces sp. SID14478]|uniref:hypothetical protein n=1 Tax=Streptomyces sp. SID14478 TaxID=2706073 RepID=UPI0013DA8524|nr:hypothetical protein [Streptomyces sp. SID14478]NEB75056.1 hypothetical protein [Streptomyces sp. SID14478]
MQSELLEHRLARRQDERRAHMLLGALFAAAMLGRAVQQAWFGVWFDSALAAAGCALSLVGLGLDRRGNVRMAGVVFVSGLVLLALLDGYVRFRRQ